MVAASRLVFSILLCVTHRGEPCEGLRVMAPADPAAETARRTQEKLTISPAIATYVSQREPNANDRNSDNLVVDGSPARHALLRFDNLPPLADVEQVQLVLRCTDSSPNGGTVFGSEAAVGYGTSWNSAPRRGDGGLIELAEIGRVKRGRTYEVDISGVIARGPRGGDLSLVILPDGNDGARYSKDDAKLVLTLKEGGPGTPPEETPAPPPRTGGGVGPFQLMLWYDAAYMWQEKADQRSWCVSCSDRTDSKKSRGRSKSQSSCQTGDSVRVNKCDDDDRRQWWTWEEDGMVRAYTNRGLCWDYGSDYYHLRTCGSSSYQSFGSGPGSGFNARGNYEQHRFELYPEKKPGKCVTQEHHPKKWEQLKSQPCDRARKHKTSYWIATSPPKLSGHSLSADD